MVEAVEAAAVADSTENPAVEAEAEARFYATEEINPEEDSKKILWTSIPSAWYGSSFWKLLPAPSGLRVIET